MGQTSSVAVGVNEEEGFLGFLVIIWVCAPNLQLKVLYPVSITQVSDFSVLLFASFVIINSVSGRVFW